MSTSAGSPVKASPGGSTTPIRGPLARGQIVQAVIELIDHDGLQAAVRSIDSELTAGSTVTSQYFPDQDALLDAVVEAMLDKISAELVPQPVTVSWNGYLHQVAHSVRRVALAHPQVFPLLAARPPAGTWLQPPLQGLRLTETFLDALHGYGFVPRAAVATYRALCCLLLGHLLLEVSTMHTHDRAGHPDPPTPHDLAAYPRLAELQGELAADDCFEEFEEALEGLLDRLANKGIR